MDSSAFQIDLDLLQASRRLRLDFQDQGILVGGIFFLRIRVCERDVARKVIVFPVYGKVVVLVYWMLFELFRTVTEI